MDINKTITNVNRLIQRGNLDQAISDCHNAAYKSRDASVFNLLGDLHIRNGHQEKAVLEYRKAAKLFLSQGHVSKAIGIHKKILKISPTDTDSLVSLGEISAQRDLISDAVKYYISAAHELSRLKKSAEFLKVCKTTIALDPGNDKLRERIDGLIKSAGEHIKRKIKRE